jgi:hypothetical protein
MEQKIAALNGQPVVKEQTQKKELELPDDPLALKEMFMQEKAKAARILAEKKAKSEELTAMQTRLTTLEAEDKSRRLSAMSEADKFRTLLEEREAELDRVRKDFEARDNELKSFQKKVKVKDVTGDITWASHVPSDVREFLIDKSFADVDLSDPDSVSNAKKAIVANYSGLISAASPKGVGTDTKPSKKIASVGNMTKLSKEAYMALSKMEKAKVSSEDRKAALLAD